MVNLDPGQKAKPAFLYQGIDPGFLDRLQPRQNRVAARCQGAACTGHQVQVVWPVNIDEDQIESPVLDLVMGVALTMQTGDVTDPAALAIGAGIIKRRGVAVDGDHGRTGQGFCCCNGENGAPAAHIEHAGRLAPRRKQGVECLQAGAR